MVRLSQLARERLTRENFWTLFCQMTQPCCGNHSKSRVQVVAGVSYHQQVCPEMQIHATVLTSILASIFTVNLSGTSARHQYDASSAGATSDVQAPSSPPAATTVLQNSRN